MLRATSVYPDKEGKTSASPTSTRPERRGVSRKTVIEEAKEKVSVVELAERLGTHLRPSGKELRGCCPVHGGKNPTSFAVDLEEGVWFCYSCLRGGDVVELARFAWGYEKAKVAMAAADLLHEFGHKIPPRPASWYAKQERQKPLRDAIERARFDHLRRRLFRRFFFPSLVRIEDPEERRAEAVIFWEATEPLARMMLERLAEVHS
jgi:CHC2 zinc finger